MLASIFTYFCYPRGITSCYAHIAKVAGSRTALGYMDSFIEEAVKNRLHS
jgi:hypothetical protein